MATEAQVQANRSNAEKSTGPRTAEGKAVAAQNAVRHGLLAKEVVIKGEDSGEFEFYREQMLAELAPAGQMESMLAQRIVGLSWRLRRAERLQTAAFDKIEDPHEPLPVYPPEVASKMLAILAESNWHPPVPPARRWNRGYRTFPRSGSSIGCWCTSGGSSIVCTGRWPSCGSRRKGELQVAWASRPMLSKSTRAACPCYSWAGRPCYEMPEGGTPNGDGDERAKRTQFAREFQVGSRKFFKLYFQLQTSRLKLRTSRRKAGLRTKRVKRTQLATDRTWAGAEYVRNEPTLAPGRT